MGSIAAQGRFAVQDMREQLAGAPHHRYSSIVQVAPCVSTGDVPVIVVGGGASLCANELKGASTVVRPKHAAVANAMGAAVPQARRAEPASSTTKT